MCNVRKLVPKQKRVSDQELISQLNEYKGKLWRHIESVPSYAVKQNYVSYLERNIEDITQQLTDRKKVA